MQYKTGFWNYFPFGHLDDNEALKDWKEMGMNMPMTFHYKPERDSLEQMISLLDGCQKEGMQAIVCDVRTRFSTDVKVGKEAFIEGVDPYAAYKYAVTTQNGTVLKFIYQDFSDGL